MPYTYKEKTITNGITIAASIDLVWHAWTISERVSQWFAPMAVVEAQIGGAYELYFIPGNETSMNTKGCKITQLTKEEVLQFTWKGPDPFKEVMNEDGDLTIVTVTFEPNNEKGTKVSLEHSGFKDTEAWDNAFKWHEAAWNDVLSSLKSALENGEGILCCQP